MNYKVKAIRVIKRLTAIAKKQTQRKSSQPSKNLQVTQPCINNLYAIDFVQAGAVHNNVTARYAGMSNSGKFMKFELQSFFTSQGVQIHLLCLSTPPLKLRPVHQNLYSISTSKAA